MANKDNPLSKTLVIGILILFIGMGVISSTGNLVEDIPSNIQTLDAFDSSKELLLRGKSAYGFIAYSGISGHPLGPCYFDLDDPGHITSLSYYGGQFLAGGTWTCDERWLACQYGTGVLFEIDPETGDVTSIGGCPGGDCGLSYNPVNEKLYFVCGSAIYCEGLVCVLSGEPSYLIDIAFDRCGILYGWDSDNLWIIDIETCEATLIGPLGIDIGYGGFGHFDFDTDILYISSINSPGKLYECDEDTGECILVGNFEGGAEITALAIPYNCSNHPPNVPIIFEENASLFIYSFDQDCDHIKYLIDWDDGTTLETSWYPSGHIVEIIHEWPEPGTYEIRAKARDIYNAESDWSDPYIIYIENLPPDAPTIDGSNRGKPGTAYEYVFTSVDPEGHDIAEYILNWDDDTGKETIFGPFASGSSVTANHTWTSQRTYAIKAKAKDIYGAESNWSEFKVTIPRNKPFNFNIFSWLFERFPLLERLLSLKRVI